MVHSIRIMEPDRGDTESPAPLGMGYLRRLGGWGSPGESLLGTLWETE